FTAAGISTGDVITIGVGGTFGSAVISGITSDRLISIATTQYLSGAVISGIAYTLSERPVYTLEDINYFTITGTGNSSSTNKVYGVDQYEIGLLTPGESGIATQYGGIHAGWVGIHTYIDMHGNLRVKSETLVAMSEITSGTVASYVSSGDASDDAIFADAIITIVTQPESAVGIGTTEDAVFVVDADITPSNAPLSYQWQYSNTGVAYTSLSDGGDYSGVTTSILTVVNDDDKDDFKFKVILTSGDVTATSGIATITYA
ncbi:MAG: hypothetical protein ACO3UU_10595, partial [Minisyncoccia bacterium]